MTRLLAILLVSASTASAAITSSAHLRDRIDMYIGRVSDEYTLDARDMKNVRILNWDAAKLGKPMPKDDADLPTDAQARAWRESKKSDNDKDRESVDNLDKLAQEVIRLRKEVESLKKAGGR